MALTARQRRELLGASHRLKPVVTLAGDALTDAMVAQVRSSLTHHSLVKVRIATDSAGECDRFAADLVERVPCDLVKRVGRVVILHRPDSSAESAD